ncbi:transporter substrate-binding domain-containing protein, partial [Cetobacterium sp.]
MKKLLNVILLILITSFSYGADLVDEIISRGTLRVGTTGDYKPFTYLDNGKYVGYDIAVAESIAKELG